MIKSHTLAFNLPSEVEIATSLLYKLNEQTRFLHTVIDLGFPLEYGGDIPSDIEAAKRGNTALLIQTAHSHGYDFYRMENKGVSQNWSEVYRLLQVTDEDVLIGVEPDETPLNKGWVQAMADVLMEGSIGLVSLLMPEQEDWLKSNPNVYTEKQIAGHRCYVIHGTMSMALIGFSGKFLNKMGGIPVPDGTTIYGNIESASYAKLKEHGFEWCFLADYKVKHKEDTPIYRRYKTDITYGQYSGSKQIHFIDWLKLQK